VTSSCSRVVVLLHGIRTRGVWQKAITPTLSSAGFIPFPLDFGYFGVPALLNPRSRQSKVEWLHNELDDLRQKTRCDRLSVIAHSFGTYMIGQMLRKYPQHALDKLIMVGGILNRDYDWVSKLDDWQVGYAHNEYGTGDVWPRLAARGVGGAGDSGYAGFRCEHPRLSQQKFEYGHSDYFTVGHCERYWLPVLRRCVPDTAAVTRIKSLLEFAAMDVAHALGADPQHLRANLFLEQDPGFLSIPSGFHFNMDDPAEMDIRIEVGRGASGRAYRAGRQVVALLRQNWGEYTLAGNQLKLVHKDLKWVVSTPISDPDSRWGFSGVVNVDSIGDDKSEDELRPLLRRMAMHAGGLGKLLTGISRIADSME
jgi:pimeloyl-ACP methyl ester carboxylesterase